MENSHPAGSLIQLLSQIPDPRGRHGLRHPLAAMVTAIVCAMLTGARGYRAIAQWTRSQDANIWQQGQSVFHNARNWRSLRAW